MCVCVLPSAQLVLAYERGELPTRAFSPGAILAFMSWMTEQPPKMGNA
jgi:hypothetical protein